MGISTFTIYNENLTNQLLFADMQLSTKSRYFWAVSRKKNLPLSKMAPKALTNPFCEFS